MVNLSIGLAQKRLKIEKNIKKKALKKRAD